MMCGFESGLSFRFTGLHDALNDIGRSLQNTRAPHTLWGSWGESCVSLTKFWD